MELLPRYTARAVAGAIRVAGAGQASSLPGKLVNMVFPGYLTAHARRLTDGMALITGTNGKTTTANMAARMLRDARRHVVHNAEGANLLSGIATAFAREPDARFALLEVDEAVTPLVVRRLRHPDVIVLTNLFRDQLDRYGEVDRLAQGWAAMFQELGQTALVANADDPLVAHVALRSGLPTLFFGVENATADARHEVSDVTVCPRCATMLEYERRWLSQLGEYRCGGCGFARPPRDLWADMAAETAPSTAAAAASDAAAAGGRAADAMVEAAPRAAAASDRTGGVADAAVEAGGAGAPAQLHGRIEAPLSLRIPGLHNVYNALGALGLALELGLDATGALASLGRYQPVFGRWSCVRRGATRVQVNLAKNPAGMNQSLRTLRSVPGPKALIFILNDNIADGRDISWIWDIDMEDLLPEADVILTTGTRKHEMALRLKYAGVPTGKIRSMPTLQAALDLLQRDGHQAIYVLPTYTALKEVRATLRDWEAVSA